MMQFHFKSSKNLNKFRRAYVCVALLFTVLAVSLQWWALAPGILNNSNWVLGTLMGAAGLLVTSITIITFQAVIDLNNAVMKNAVEHFRYVEESMAEYTPKNQDEAFLRTQDDKWFVDFRGKTYEFGDDYDAKMSMNFLNGPMADQYVMFLTPVDAEG